MGEMDQLSSAERAKDRNLQRVYKKTLAQKHVEIAEQGGGCAICGRPYPEYTLYQDHDHNCCNPPRGKKARAKATFCGKCNRGWLCYICNRFVIGALEYAESVRVPIAKVMPYLTEWNQRIKERGGYEPKQPVKTTKRRRKAS
jgi:hypothetical protein